MNSKKVAATLFAALLIAICSSATVVADQVPTSAPLPSPAPSPAIPVSKSADATAAGATIPASASQSSTASPSAAAGATIPASASQSSTASPSAAAGATIPASASQSSTASPSAAAGATIPASASQSSTASPSAAAGATIPASASQSSTASPSAAGDAAIGAAASKDAGAVIGVSDTKEEPVAGPLLEQRRALLDHINQAGAHGIGVANYLTAYKAIEGQVAGGANEDQIKARLVQLTLALKEQLQRAQVLKTQRPLPPTSSQQFGSAGQTSQLPAVSGDLLDKLKQKLGGTDIAGGSKLDQLLNSDKARELLNSSKGQELLKKFSN